MTASRMITAVVLAFLIAGSCTLWFSRKLSGRSSHAAQIHYLAARKDVDAGQVLKAEDIRTIDWPSANALPGAVTKPEELVARTALYRIAAGQPILDRQLAAPGATVGLSARIPEGMRAISLKSDQVIGVAGFLLPGTHADVLVTLRSPSSSEAITSTVLQDVQILAAGQKLQAEADGKPATVDVVTILVTPEDGEKVILASTLGTVHFVMRNSNDQKVVSHAPTGVEALQLSGARQPTVAVARATIHAPSTAARYVMNVTRGDKQTAESF